MTTITFQDSQWFDMNPALTLEDIIQMYSAYAGVHHTKFLDTVRLRPAAAADWTVVSGTWDFPGGALATGSSGADFDIAWSKETVPSSYVVEVSMQPYGGRHYWAVALRGTDNSNYFVFELQFNAAAFYQVADGQASIISNLPQVVDGIFLEPGILRVGVREVTFDGKTTWLFFTAWVNDHFVLSCAVDITESTPGKKFGLAVGNGQNAFIDDVRIPDLTEIIPAATLDPDEMPLGAIQRGIADRVIKLIIRYDGTLFAWRPYPTSTVQTFTASNDNQFSHRANLREYCNHIRLWYALDSVTVIDSAGVELYGHRFRELTSQVIEVESEAYAEALAHLRRAKENAFGIALRTLSGGALLEPEDRFVAPDGEAYLVDSVSTRYERATLGVSVQGRLYAF